MESAINIPHKSAEHIIANHLQFIIRNGFGTEPFKLLINFFNRLLGYLAAHFSGDNKKSRVQHGAEHGTDSIGKSFVFADVRHEARAEVTAEDGAQNHQRMKIRMTFVYNSLPYPYG